MALLRSIAFVRMQAMSVSSLTSPPPPFPHLTLTPPLSPTPFPPLLRQISKDYSAASIRVSCRCLCLTRFRSLHPLKLQP
jgi:hypothetical protein